MICAQGIFSVFLSTHSTSTTESPLRNILLMNLSLLTGRDALWPLPVLGICKAARRTPHASFSVPLSLLHGQAEQSCEAAALCCRLRDCCARCRVALTSVHISVTFSRIILQCLSKALTRPRSLWLFRQLMRTCARRQSRGGTRESLRAPSRAVAF